MPDAQSGPKTKATSPEALLKARRAHPTVKESSTLAVCVAPPSGNTAPSEAYQILHKGFDTLALAVKANIPPDLFEYLEVQKELAEKEQCDVLIEWNGVQLHLKGHGGMGYRFIASGRSMGANWAIKKPNAKDPWGLRVIFGSTFLATLGLGAASAHLNRVLDRFGISTKPENFSISRVDYCVDLLAPEFVLNPEAFVMHSSTNRRDYIANLDMLVNGSSGRVTSVTVGSTHARQVIIYDKRLEVIQKQKPHWWKIWNKAREDAGQPLIGPETADVRIWRVEYRVGKNLLKDGWNIRTWQDLFDRFGDLCAQTGGVIRYTEPNPSDSNWTRRPNHMLWETALGEINTDLFEMYEGSDPNPIKKVQKEQHISLILKNIKGTTITLAALEGIKADGLQDFFSQTAKRLAMDVQANPEKSRKQLGDAQDRYVFVTRERPE